MADSYLEFSETLDDLTSQEEQWLRKQLEIISVCGDREYAEGDVPHDMGDTEHWHGCRAWRDLPEFDPESDPLVGFEYEFLEANGRERRHLWFHAQECGYPDRVAHLVQKFLRTFRPNQYWTLSYAATCSKPRAGEFGGGCVFVTASEIVSYCSWDFLEDRVTAFRKNGLLVRTGSEVALRSYDLAVDGPTFKVQRKRLLKLADTLNRGRQLPLIQIDKALLDGLINLTDEIADQAADRYGIDCLVSTDEGGGAS